CLENISAADRSKTLAEWFFVTWRPPILKMGDGMLEYWSNAFASTPILQYSIIPIVTTFHTQVLFAGIPLRHFGKEAFLFELLKKTQVNELLGFKVLCLRQGRREHIEHELNALQSRIGLLGDRLDIAVIRILEHGGVVAAHVLGEDALRFLLVCVNEINRLNEPFERRLHGVPIAGNVRARRRKAIALDFDTEVADLHQLIQPRFAC